MYKAIVLYLVGFMQLIAPACAASEPVLLAQLANGGSLYVLGQDDQGPVKRVQLRTVYASPVTRGGFDNVLSTVSVERIDCVKQQAVTERVSIYANPEASGDALASTDLAVSDGNAVAIDPRSNTALAKVFVTVCRSMETASRTPAPSPTVPHVALAPEAPGGQAGPVVTPIAQAPAQGAAAVAPARALPSPAPLSPAPQAADNSGSPPPAPPGPPEPQVPLAPQKRGEAGGVLAESKPFAGTTFTLGVMGLLAEYVYYDKEHLDFLRAVRDKLQRGREAYADADGQRRPLFDTSFAQVDHEVRDYEAKLAEKQRFLTAANLVPVRLPEVSPTLWASFRGELYKHGPSEETVLVFRGTASALDWLTNLWMGVDLFEFEAPNYVAARKLTDEVLKRGFKPIVVGHSLGAGMAQYVGVHSGLRVVGFNSSPLPERYISSRPADPRQIRLFSAIETDGEGAAGNTNTPNRFRPDPVSISFPNFGEWVNHSAMVDGEFVKAHQHLVKPLCVLSRPVPFMTQQESEQRKALVSSFTAKGMFTGVLSPGLLNLHKTAPAEQGVVLALKASVKKGMNNPVWRPDSSSAFDKAVAAEVVERVQVAAVKVYQNTFTTASVARTGAEIIWGSTWKGLLDVGVTAAKTAGANMLMTHGLMPHAMDRFNRGMQAALSSDVFEANVVLARCAAPTSIY